MGLFDTLKMRARDVKQEKLQVRAAERDIRKKSLAVELVAQREESIKVAREKGIARARRPTGIAAFTAGLGKLSAGVSKLAPPSKGRRKPIDISNIYGTPSKSTKGKSMLDFKF